MGRRAITLGVAAACSLAVAACGSSSSSSSSSSSATSTGGSSSAASASSSGAGNVTIDVGTQKLTFPKGTKPNIAMFAGSGIAYQTAYQKAVPLLEKKYGIKITYFDSKFVPNTQLAQMRTAAENKKYNAWIVENYDGAASCSVITKTAPEAGIAVSIVSDPTCSAPTKPFGPAYWSPGTLNSVGAQSSLTYYTNWVREAKAMVGSGPLQVGVINGPPLVPATENLDAAMKSNGITPVANEASDYTTPTALKQTANMIQAHPGMNAIFSVGPDATTGVVAALKAAGKKPGQVKIFDVGADGENDVPLIKQGWLTMTVPYNPVTEIDTAVQQLVAAFNGQQGPHFLPALSAGTPTNPFAVTAKNVASYKPQY